MKVLINSNFKALRRGDFVKANATAGEFLLSEESDLSVGTLKEIAKTNGVQVKSKDTKAEILSALIKHFGEIKMTEQNDITVSEKVLSIVKAGFEAGKSDDDIMIDIINDAGAKFSQAKKLFKQAVDENNLRLSPKDRKEQVATILEEAEFAPKDWADVDAMIKKIVADVEHTEPKQALSAIRSWCKANEVELPKKTKVAGERKVFRDLVFDHIIANPEISEEDIAAWVGEQKAESKNLEKLQASAVSFLKFARQYYEAVA